VSDFGRRIEKSFALGEELEKMLVDTKADLDTFASMPEGEGGV
jgi:hypothetical protein